MRRIGMLFIAMTAVVLIATTALMLQPGANIESTITGNSVAATQEHVDAITAYLGDRQVTEGDLVCYSDMYTMQTTHRSIPLQWCDVEATGETFGIGFRGERDPRDSSAFGQLFCATDDGTATCVLLDLTESCVALVFCTETAVNLTIVFSKGGTATVYETEL